MNKEDRYGDAKLECTSLELGCDNCGACGSLGVKYKPKHRQNKELELCELCAKGLVLTLNMTGVLD